MLNLATEKSLAVDEVAFMLLREQCGSFGFACDHSNVGYSKTDHKPYCKHCYSRLELLQSTGLLKGKIIRQSEHIPKETFVDLKRKENAKKNEADIEARIEAEVEANTRRILDAAANKDKEKDASTFEDRKEVQ